VLKVVTNKGSLNGTTRFIWGGGGDWQCLEERDSSGDLVARFTYAPGYIDAVAVQERDLNSDSDFLDSNELVYYHQNTLFSVYALSDSGENVVERYRYDAYGAVTVLDADGSADADGLSDVENPYVFTGRRLDVESGLMQYRNRYYSPTLGRFMSRDPQQHHDSHDLYSYVGERPTTRSDPTGEARHVIYECSLTSSALVGECGCTRMCYYSCVPVEHHSRGTMSPTCDELDISKLSYTPVKHKSSLLCRLTGGWIGSPGDCQQTFRDAQYWSHYQLPGPDRNCSVTECVRKAESTREIALEACDQIKDPVEKAICIGGAEAACSMAVAICEAWCKNR